MNSEIKISTVLNYQGKFNPRGIRGILISVCDAGIGINKEDLPRIFKRFFRAESVIEKTPGTGLGLSIAKELVNLHQGEIFVLSKIGKGTSIHIFLPETKNKNS